MKGPVLLGLAYACLHAAPTTAQTPNWYATPSQSQQAVQPSAAPWQTVSAQTTLPILSTSLVSNCGPAGCVTTGCGESGCAPGEGCDAPGECEQSCCHGFLDYAFGDDPWLPDLKKQKAGGLTWSAGGALRHRYMDEDNRFRPGGPAESQYDLWRFTPYVEMGIDGMFNVHLEGIDSSAFGYDAPLFPLGIDENRSDLLQGYIDISLTENITFRYGRQFLSYGSQHLLSPLGWSNTFRNFEGSRLMFTAGDWNIDAFHMNSVNNAAGGPLRPTSFDTSDQSRTISGVYSTYNGFKNNTIDLYWLWSQEDDRQMNRQDGDRHTIGSRFASKREVKSGKELVGTFNLDVEGALQFGEDDFMGGGANQDVFAGFLSATGGYTFNNCSWTPSLGGIFYYGSGDDDPTDGEINTVHTLYPLGHAYWGQIDNFSGENLLDFGLTASVKPHAKFLFAANWHSFHLATDNDNMYNIAGAPFALAPGETHVGNEVDLVGTVSLTPNINIQLGYFWFFYGDAVNDSAFARPDATQVYAQTTLTF